MIPPPLVDKLFVLITCLLVECYVLFDWLEGLANKYLAPDQGNGIPTEFRGEGTFLHHDQEPTILPSGLTKFSQ